jgi:hypothetical protein
VSDDVAAISIAIAAFDVFSLGFSGISNLASHFTHLTPRLLLLFLFDCHSRTLLSECGHKRSFKESGKTFWHSTSVVARLVFRHARCFREAAEDQIFRQSGYHLRNRTVVDPQKHAREALLPLLCRDDLLLCGVELVSPVSLDLGDFPALESPENSLERPKLRPRLVCMFI